MEFSVDPDVKTVLEFMQSKVPASKLVAVASAVCELGHLLWGQYKSAEDVELIRLVARPPR